MILVSNLLPQKLANREYQLPLSVQTPLLVCKNTTISLHPSRSSVSHSHRPPPLSPPCSPPLCFIYLADMQPLRWQLCPSKGTCSWWLFAHLPVQSAADECQRSFAPTTFFVFLFLPLWWNVFRADGPPVQTSGQRGVLRRHCISSLFYVYHIFGGVLCWGSLHECVRWEFRVLLKDIS